MSFDELAKIKIDLKAKERLEASQSLSTFQRVTSIRPKKAFAWSFVAGLLIVVAVYMARLRWAKWPLHPILFLVWNTWVSHVFFWSFLAAWVIRLLADKYVTRAGVKALKVVMVGVVSGELLGGMFWLVVGWIYFACTGNHPPYYNIFPY